MLKRILAFITLVVTPFCVQGHGMVIQPINRASRWRFDALLLPNYNDNELFCGGQRIQWEENDGKCGLCGDNYADASPRNHELGGIYGEGNVVENYTSGEIIPVQVLVTANHMGFFVFTLCDLDTFGHESDECFESITLYQPNGNERFYIDPRLGSFDISLKLPENLQCEHCVLRWTWTTGNTWGECDNGEFNNGCGPQETFRTCSDIAIFNATYNM